MKFLWTTIHVRNLDESIAFYTYLLELKVLRRFPAGPGMELAFLGNGDDGETTIELLADANNTSVSHNDFVSIGFAVDSVKAMMDIVGKKGITVQSGPVETPGSVFFMIKDPNGFNIQFFQRKG